MKTIPKSNMVYCIGDSHVTLFSGNNKILPEWPAGHKDNVPLFSTYFVGPRLAYNISTEKSIGRRKIDSIISKIPKNSYIMFVFGEIDCRVHLIREAKKQKRNINEVVCECVDRYFILIKDFAQKGYSPIVWCITPSTIFNLPNIELPTFRNWKERNNVTRIFNKQLNKLAKKQKYPVISIYNKLIDKNGRTNMNYFIDPIHLSTNALPLVLMEFESKINGINKEFVNSKSSINLIEYIYNYYIRRSLYFAFIIFKNLTHFPFPRREKLTPY